MNFNFTHYISKKKATVVKPFVRISRQGVIQFPKSTLVHYGLSGRKATFVKMYEDEERRTFGFVFTDKNELGEKYIRLMKIRSFYTKSASGKEYANEMACLSISSFLNRIGNVQLPSKRLYISSYYDTLFNLTILYITLPKSSEAKVYTESK